MWIISQMKDVLFTCRHHLKLLPEQLGRLVISAHIGPKFGKQTNSFLCKYQYRFRYLPTEHKTIEQIFKWLCVLFYIPNQIGRN